MTGTFTSTIGRRFGLTPVVVIRGLDGPDESRTELDCQYQGKAGYFDIDAAIDEGDYVELDDPRTGGKMRHHVQSVELNHSPFNKAQSHIKATWGPAPRTPQPAVVNNSTTITISGSHNAVATGNGAIAKAKHIASAGPAEYRALGASVAKILEAVTLLDVAKDDREALVDSAEPLLESLSAETPDTRHVRKLAVGLKNAVAGIAHSAHAGTNAAIANFVEQGVAEMLAHIESLG